MIDISMLDENDKGRKVRYTSSNKDKIEEGKITSWNNKFIFVRYYQQNKPYCIIRYGETSEATDPKDLDFI